MFKKLKVSTAVKMIIEDVQEILYYIALVGMALFFFVDSLCDAGGQSFDGYE